MRHPLTLLTMALLILPVWTTAAQPVFFEELMLVDPLPVRFGDAAWGDYDNDGDLDLMLSGSLRPFDKPQSFTQLYRNDGNVFILIQDATGVFVEVPAVDYADALNVSLPILEDVWQSAVAWGDYDNDGDLDPAVTGVNQNGMPSLRIYQNIGGEDLLALHFPFPGIRSGDLDWGDYDNDGDLDIVICGLDAFDMPVLTIYENQVAEEAGFVPRQGLLPGLGSCGLEWGDYDADGDMDLLMTGIAVPQAFVAKVYRNDGATFVDAGVDLKKLLFASGAWGDYDADGDLDILLSGARLTPFLMEGEIKIYRNDAGTFVDEGQSLVGSFENEETLGRYQGAVGWGDFDNDGYLDFFVTGVKDPLSAESLQVYSNNRNGTFTKSGTERFDGGIFGGAFWGDYDSDNDLDIFVLGEEPIEGPSIKALRNNLGFGKAPPTAPDALQANPQGNTVTLAWNPATDNRTPTAGLTYNIRVGTTPGGLDVVSPMAEPATGRRQLSRRGNTGHATAWTLKRLPPGTYFWSVQALDNSFSSSTFAPEGTFTITTNAQTTDR